MPYRPNCGTHYMDGTTCPNWGGQGPTVIASPPIQKVSVLAVGSFSLVVGVFGILAAIAIPSQMRTMAKSRQSEAKTNLGAIFTCEVAFHGETDRYAYFLAGQTIQPDQGGPYELPPGFTPRADDEGFLAVAVGNIGNGETLDVWTINDTKTLVNLTNDVNVH